MAFREHVKESIRGSNYWDMTYCNKCRHEQRKIEIICTQIPANTSNSSKYNRNIDNEGIMFFEMKENTWRDDKIEDVKTI